MHRVCPPAAPIIAILGGIFFKTSDSAQTGMETRRFDRRAEWLSVLCWLVRKSWEAMQEIKIKTKKKQF